MTIFSLENSHMFLRSKAMRPHYSVFLLQMQHIWDEVGESDSYRDKMLLQLEQECLEVYRRKVDHASQARAQLHQDLANAEAEFAALFSALGETPISLRVSSCIHSCFLLTFSPAMSMKTAE